MAKRRARPRTFDNATQQDLGAIDTPIDPFGIPAGFDPSTQDAQGADIAWTASLDPDFMQAVVAAGTPLQSSVVTVARNYPQAGYDTWYAPTTGAIARGKINAAIETAADAGAQIVNVGAGLARNFGPILLGIAALYVLFQWQKFK